MNQRRQQNYETAFAILNGTYLNDALTQKKASVINQEFSKIIELDDQYEKASIAAERTMTTVLKDTTSLEERAQQSTEIVRKFEAAIQNILNSRNNDYSTTKRETKKDMDTYARASALLQERIQKANEELSKIQTFLDEFEPELIFHNPQAQELYLQLRSLLTAQEKELRSLGSH